MVIDFSSKINYDRAYERSIDSHPHNRYQILQRFESDRGRIVNSAAIRRLQQKTQVFPLERNAVVRSRLTHSMEVQQVGRYIVKEIFYRLQKTDQLDFYGLTEWQDSIETLVEMGCLMHDIGNPPFGHFGERAINSWFAHRIGLHLPEEDQQERCRYPIFHLNEYADLNVLKMQMRQDLCHFEGNAQGIRLVHTLLQLNLTYSQIAMLLKYSAPAYWLGETPKDFEYLMKKPGYYLSESAFIAQLRSKVGLATFSRYPLAYIVEAADDISYCLADLEDAVEKQILTIDQLYALLEQEWKNGETISVSHCFEQTIKRAYNEYSQIKRKDEVGCGENQFFIFLRVNVIRLLVEHATERFIENLPMIFHGDFNQSLLEDHGVESKLLDMFKTVACRYVFNHQSVEQLELQGYTIIRGLLDIYSPLLAMSMQDFRLLEAKNNHQHYLIESRLLHRVPTIYRSAYRDALVKLEKMHTPLAEFEMWELYYRCRLLQDYISGMTDHFAYDEFRALSVAI